VVPRQTPGSSPTPADQVGAGTVEVRRSARRRRTVSAYRDGDRTVVLLPARMSRADERHWVDVMLERLFSRERRTRPSDPELLDRARRLSRRYLDGCPEPASVHWVSNQGARWGSCTVEDRTIRLSDRLQGAPEYVLDYVLLHELVHLVVPDHGPDFWAELSAYPRTERARGFLEAWPGGSASDRSPDAAPAAPAAVGEAPAHRPARGGSSPQFETLFDQRAD
jgi:predicted metal-dependent hydrolase